MSSPIESARHKYVSAVSTAAGPDYITYPKWLGADTPVVTYYGVDSGLQWHTLTYGANGSYTGLDRFGRVVAQTWQNNQGTGMDSFSYAYDRASNRVSRERTLAPGDKDEYYLYDGLDRLIKMNRGDLSGGVVADGSAVYSQAWASLNTTPDPDVWESRLDGLGNWGVFKVDDNGGGSGDGGWLLSQTRRHNSVNEIDDDNTHGNAPSASTISETTGTAWQEPVYDAAGNMVLCPQPGDEGAAAARLHLVYDAWNRLVEAWRDDGGQTPDGELERTGGDMDTMIATYRYDGLGRRIRKLLGADPSEPDKALDYYYNERWQVLEVREDGDGDPRKQYVWDDVRYIDAPACRLYDGNLDGDAVDVPTDNVLYYQYDANQNVTAVAENLTNYLVEFYEYEAYGRPKTLHGAMDATWTPTGSAWQERTQNTFDNEVLFAGYRWDPETGLYQVRHRMYHPTLGRWGQRDPAMKYAGGMSLYAYVSARPTISVDPTGEFGQMISMVLPIAQALANMRVRPVNVRWMGLRGGWDAQGPMIEPLPAQVFGADPRNRTRQVLYLRREINLQLEKNLTIEGFDGKADIVIRMGDQCCKSRCNRLQFANVWCECRYAAHISEKQLIGAFNGELRYEEVAGSRVGAVKLMWAMSMITDLGDCGPWQPVDCGQHHGIPYCQNDEDMDLPECECDPNEVPLPILPMGPMPNPRGVVPLWPPLAPWA
jgi:RHS repeat-associated protein